MLLFVLITILTFGIAQAQVVIKARNSEPGYHQERQNRQWRHRQWQRNHRRHRIEDQH